MCSSLDIVPPREVLGLEARFEQIELRWLPDDSESGMRRR